jgi:hypothetical protein
VGVVQLAEDLGLARKALDVTRGAVRLEELERDRSPGLLIDRAENRAHTAGGGPILDQKTLRKQLTRDRMPHEPWCL